MLMGGASRKGTFTQQLEMHEPAYYIILNRKPDKQRGRFEQIIRWVLTKVRCYISL